MVQKILTRFLLLWLTLTCFLAYMWSEVFEGPNPFVMSSFVMQGSIALTMLVIGSLLPADELKLVAHRWPKVAGGTLVQYLAMPLLALAAAHIFHLEGAYFYGVMLVGCVPGAMASNMLTLFARGNVSYSVGLTTSATLLSPIIVPLTLWLAVGKFVQLDALEMSRTLLLTVVAPVSIGFVLAQYSALWRGIALKTGEIVANVVIILIIASVVAKNHDAFQDFPIGLIWPMLFINFGGYAAGLAGGRLLRLDRRMTSALMIEVGMQNAGLGAFLAGKYFPNEPRAALCCAMYTFGCMFTGILVAQVLRVLNSREASRFPNAVSKNKPH
ncbi:MAG: bile acid:sodium symporter [Planctomycetia bacterium]|nr:bile acid:sodium symporter [Planctomycetia bacterium]